MNHHKILGLPVFYLVRRRLTEFSRKAKDLGYWQNRALHNALGVVAGSAYAKDRGLKTGMGVEDLRKALPVQTYEDVQPYIKKMMQGEFSALLAEQHPAEFFATTSGTTGPIKYIPVTKLAAAQYQKSWLLWGMALSQYDQDFLFNRVLNLTGGGAPLQTAGGTPIGSITGMLSASLKGWLRHAYVLSPGVAHIPDQDRRYYLISRLALLNPNIQMINTANPSTLLLFHEYLEREGAHHIREIYDGRIKGVDYLSGYVEPKILGQALRSNRKLAAKLEKSVERAGCFAPSAIWPQLKIIGVWTGGSLKAYLPAVRQVYGDAVLLRDHGLCASEGRISVPVTFGHNDGVLNFTDNFYEFIPEDSPEQILTADELVLGKSYRIVLTNCAGLLRYDMNDIVRVEGFWHGAPTLSFQHKGSHIANITGEKLTATQVARSLQKVFSHSIGNPPRNFTVFPQYGANGCYLLCLEDGLLQREALESLTTQLDQELKAANFEYFGKRESGRLGPIIPHVVPAGSFARFRQVRLERGSGIVEQYKQPVLLAAPEDISQWQEVIGYA